MFEDKYSPSNFSDFMFPNDQLEAYFQNVINGKQAISNLVFYGPYGSGKTSFSNRLPYLLASNISDFDICVVNASSQNRLTDVRNSVGEFCKTWSLNSSNFRFVIIDEIDGMNSNAQQALRSLMTETIGHVRYFITSNDLNKVDRAIRSRCRSIHFANFEPAKRVERVRQILASEGLVGIDDKVILDLLNECSDDNRELFRKIEDIVIEFRNLGSRAA